MAVFNTRPRLTVDGHEEMFAVTHLAHDLLTRLLLEHIGQGETGRIVNVASGAHILVREIWFDDLTFEHGFRLLRVYSHSKLANVLFSHALSSRLSAPTSARLPCTRATSPAVWEHTAHP